ncbi:MAG TPA: response regulator [Bacteroidia bacterium]|nr:response regulator [Bacteroidia bacterium]
MNTLIIDDDLFLQKALSFGLLESGHTVTIAGNGQEAIELIAKNRGFDLIFCDVMMPVLTGPAFLLMLKKFYPKSLPTIVIISGVKDGEDFLKKIEIKYDHFLHKPLDLNEVKKLLSAIELTKPVI